MAIALRNAATNGQTTRYQRDPFQMADRKSVV